jgi:hypothetical protein
MDHDALQMDEPLCEVCRNPDRIVLGDDFDVEYFQAKAKLAKTTGRALNDITEEEVRKYMRMDISR